MLEPFSRRREALSRGTNVSPRQAGSWPYSWSFFTLLHGIDFQRDRGDYLHINLVVVPLYGAGGTPHRGDLLQDIRH